MRFSTILNFVTYETLKLRIETVPAEGLCGKFLEIAKEKTRSDGKIGIPDDSQDLSGGI
jgi:hypothetical protein